MQMKLTSALSFLSKRNVCLHESSFLEGEGGVRTLSINDYILKFIVLFLEKLFLRTTDVCAIAD